LAKVAGPLAGGAAQAGTDAGSNDQKMAAFRAQFDAATAAAYKDFPNDCSHYLQSFLKRMGYADTPYRTANEFMAFVQQKGSGWKTVTADEAVRQSAAGEIVVAGLADTRAGHSGHVMVVGPKFQPSGGPSLYLPVGTLSPQTFGGASSGYAGARSQGEHTVRDAWSSGQRPNVTYWVKEQ
jgi:hypothetical protein